MVTAAALPRSSALAGTSSSSSCDYQLLIDHTYPPSRMVLIKRMLTYAGNHTHTHTHTQLIAKECLLTDKDILKSQRPCFHMGPHYGTIPDAELVSGSG